MKFMMYAQVAQWEQLSDCELSPTDWGWKVVENKKVPIMTNQVLNNISSFRNRIIFQEIALPEWLKIIRCNCKASSRNSCKSKLCSCVANGLKCVSACGDCQGTNCSNVTVDKVHCEDDCLNDNI